MIFTDWSGVAFRVHDPRWAYDPLSGKGAATHGGRANRPGINALYLSTTIETAIAEYRQLDALLQPALIVSYRISVAQIVDFTCGYNSTWENLWQDFFCDWRKLKFNDGVEPPSWAIGDHVLATGGKGIMFRSALSDGANLVLFPDFFTDSDLIRVHDPNFCLPKNQNSWL